MNVHLYRHIKFDVLFIQNAEPSTSSRQGETSTDRNRSENNAEPSTSSQGETSTRSENKRRAHSDDRSSSTKGGRNKKRKIEVIIPILYLYYTLYVIYTIPTYTLYVLYVKGSCSHYVHLIITNTNTLTH